MKHIKWLKYALLGLYSAWMLYLLFFMRIDAPQEAIQVQLIPLRTLAKQLYELFTRRPIMPSLVQLIGNTALFAPFGLLLPWCFTRLQKPRTLALTAILMEISIEALQGITQLGLCDIDDVILNLLGIACGYLLYRMLASRKEKRGC